MLHYALSRNLELLSRQAGGSVVGAGAVRLTAGRHPLCGTDWFHD